MNWPLTDSNVRRLAGVFVGCATHFLVLSAAAGAIVSLPQTVYWDAAHLAAIRTAPHDNAVVEEALANLRRFANGALHRGPYSVVEKSIVPPSGDKHDYMSFSRYWWPNPETEDGLPYVRRDGEVNRKLLARGDRNRIGSFYDDVEALALAAYLLHDNRYAEHAGKLVRAWFLEPDTRMNPNLKFGQAVPGRADGRAPGIIDTRHFIRVLDACELLDHTGNWTAEDRRGMREWFSEYLDWLLTSSLGQKEHQAKNNHGTWYDAQTARIALFIGDQPRVREIVEAAKVRRVASGIEPDGRQPAELKRTRSLHYSIFNLSALAVLSRVGETVDVDLWTYETADGRGFRTALDFLLPFLDGAEQWPYEQLEPYSMSPRGSQLFLMAADRFQDRRYLLPLKRLPRREQESDWTPLLHATSQDAD